VYSLAEELRADPERLRRAQEGASDPAKCWGYKMTYGLFGSDEWWENIKNGVIPTWQLSGVIVRRFYAKEMDSKPKANYVNRFEMINEKDGASEVMEFWTNNKGDKDLYRIGHRVVFLYAVLECKYKGHSLRGDGFNDREIEVAVSRKPVV